jgi:hypothetical protein
MGWVEKVGVAGGGGGTGGMKYARSNIIHQCSRKAHRMALPEDDVVIVQEKTCSTDTAIAKMLGWLRGSVRKRVVPVTEYGIPLEALPMAHSLGCTVDEQLRDLRDAARAKLFALPPVELSEGDLLKMDSEVALIDDLTEKAAMYRAAIHDELARGSESMLRLDPAASESADEEQITLTSLNEWVIDRFGVAILPAFKPERSPVLMGQQEGLSDQKAVPQPVARTKLRDQGKAILLEIRNQGHDPKNLPKSKPNAPGVKAKVRAVLQKPSGLFNGPKVFDKAWERLREDGDIADKK